jgi:probable F420-dependent oxidoreductase
MTSSLDMKKIGIWTFDFDAQPASKVREAVAELDQLGYGAVWFGEALGRESLTQAALLLSASSHIVVATGITNIYGRDPVTAVNGQRALSEAYPERFIFGLGVSHVPLVERMRGHEYQSPIAKMSGYLDAMDKAPYQSVAPATTYRVLAALGPKMLELSAKRSNGAHSYNVTPEHTSSARRMMGAEPWLCVEQAVVIERDASKAREIARGFLKLYLGLPNYTNNFLRLGFTEADCQNGGSDRLIDAIVAWGDLDTVTQRVRAHLDAGASHVCVQALAKTPKTLPMQEWRELAGALIKK